LTIEEDTKDTKFLGVFGRGEGLTHKGDIGPDLFTMGGKEEGMALACGQGHIILSEPRESSVI
jgi:hypothetical protein